MESIFSLWLLLYARQHDTPPLRSKFPMFLRKAINCLDRKETADGIEHTAMQNIVFRSLLSLRRRKKRIEDYYYVDYLLDILHCRNNDDNRNTFIVHTMVVVVFMMMMVLIDVQYKCRRYTVLFSMCI